MKKHTKKVVVLDMDETLGSFVQLGIVVTTLEHSLNRKLTNVEINHLFNLFPHYVRPNIITILNYLKTQKRKGKCDKVYIYTNNQGPKSWALHIKQFFEHKVDYPLFDGVIHAYKVDGKQVEKNRTTHNKTVSDFMKCSKLKPPVVICFVDDQYHSHMLKSNVQYIHIREYLYFYKPHHIIQKIDSSNIFSRYNSEHLLNNLQSYHEMHITHSEKEKETSKKLMIEFQQFFKSFGDQYTRTKQHKHKKKTMKNNTKKHYKHIN